ncbi:epidermis-specific secreted glycoprotein EP1-like [Hibiscus syriacus]|uniref:Sulfotransferase n=1 Tax=Hibiscus syriacus TaxID=106335 RepID=A0A6A3C0U3_HIBSY|nr:epidermis-specific secreted glycoprotein EP1-like [Hibiscus syriacus]
METPSPTDQDKFEWKLGQVLAMLRQSGEQGDLWREDGIGSRTEYFSRSTLIQSPLGETIRALQIFQIRAVLCHNWLGFPTSLSSDREQGDSRVPPPPPSSLVSGRGRGRGRVIAILDYRNEFGINRNANFDYRNELGINLNANFDYRNEFGINRNANFDYRNELGINRNANLDYRNELGINRNANFDYRNANFDYRNELGINRNANLDYHNEFGINRNAKPKELPPLTLEETFESFCEGVSHEGPFWDHLLGYWKASSESPEKVLFLKYEDVKKKLWDYERKVAEFLGVPFSIEEEKKEMAEEIVKLCSFENMSKQDGNKRDTTDTKHPISNADFFRKGEIGDWVNHLSPQMVQTLDQITNQKFQGTGLGFN